MKNKANKVIFRILLIVSFLTINAFVLAGIGAVWSYMNTGADKSSILHLEAPMEAIYTPKISWRSLENPGRPMEDQTIQKIQRDYLNAWHVRNIAYKENDHFGISDFYTDSAKVRLFEHIDLNIKNNNWFKSTTIEHQPELDFYSEDGTLVVFTDHDVERYQEAYHSDSLVFHQKDTASYQVMMLLEDGFWRIRHMQKQEPIKKTTNTLVRNIDSSLVFVNSIKGINYYPQNTPWDTFGEQFNDSIINEDFEILKTMGINTIRIFEQYEDFGKSQVEVKKLERLRKTLDLANSAGLKVMITLFDFYGDYDLMNWTLTHRHAETIIKAMKDHPALLAWDIKNEPDLDFDSRGKHRVISWLDEMADKIKQWDPNHPVTIGWSSPEAAINLVESVDFVSYHYYGEVDKFLTAHVQLKSRVNDKPVLLQEYGLSSYDSFWNLYQGGENAQATYYTKMQAQLEDAKTPYIFWTLYDFEEVPTSVAGHLPWRTRKQAYFGCIDTNGKKKLVFNILSK